MELILWGCFDKTVVISTPIGALPSDKYSACLALFFFQAEDGIRDCLLSRGLGDVYKRQPHKISSIP